MMVLIMTNINHLVILICSIVLLLSSFVFSQQRLKRNEDPLEYFNYALFLRTHHPEYYAKNYGKFVENYNKLISAAEAKRNTRNSKNNGQFEQDGVSNSAGPKTAMHGDLSGYRTPLVKNYNPMEPKSVERAGRAFSRSLNNHVSPEEEDFEKARREMSDRETIETNMDKDWVHYCFNLGYNNTDNVCRSDQNEKIKLAPNVTICLEYFKLACKYRFNGELCGAAVNEVMRNISFDCNDINVDGDIESMSFQCCMACKGGINTATSKDNCAMHSDSSMPSLAQEKCCKNFLSPNASVSTTESISTTESTATTEKPGSMEAIFAHIKERFSNSTTQNSKLEIDSSTITAASPLLTTTTTTTTTITSTTTTATPTTATPTSTQATTSPPTSTTTATTTTTIEPTTTTTTPTPTTTTSTTTTTSPSPSTTTTTTPQTITTTETPPTTTDEPKPAESLLVRSKSDELNSLETPEGYKIYDEKKNLYEKIDEEDRSKADFMVIFVKELKIENEGFYKNFKLMNVTLRNDVQCDWEFNIEKVDAEVDKPLSEENFVPEPEKYRFVLYLNGEVQPQTIQYSVACNINKYNYKYYNYSVNLTFK